jgi:hypothetical protein
MGISDLSFAVMDHWVKTVGTVSFFNFRKLENSVELLRSGSEWARPMWNGVPASTLRGLYRRNPPDGGQGVAPTDDRFGGSPSERLDLIADETPAR